MLKAEGYEVISSSAGHDQHALASEPRVSDAKRQVPLQASAEFLRTYNARAHEIVDAITAAVTNAQAGLNWLRAEPPDLEEARQAFNSIASAGNRAAETVVRLRALVKKMPTADGVPHP
jgi:isocitrate lyase